MKPVSQLTILMVPSKKLIMAVAIASWGYMASLAEMCFIQVKKVDCLLSTDT